MDPYKSMHDLKLICLLKQDDEMAFAEIYHRYANSLTGFASSKLYNAEDSIDLVHDLFLKLWNERSQLQVDRSLKSFLFTLIRHRIIDKVRKNLTHVAYAEMVGALKVKLESSIEQQFTATELQEAIHSSCAELSPRVQEIFQLSREENLSIPEIAEKLQLSERTIKNQLSVALKHLRQSLTIIPIYIFTLWIS